MDYSAMYLGSGMPIQWHEDELISKFRREESGTESTIQSKIKPIFSIQRHSNDITCIEFSGRNLLATSSLDKSIRIYKWLPEDQFEELSYSPLTGHTYGINGLSFSPYGSKLASASTDGQTFIWNVKTGEKLSSLFLPKKRGLGVRTCVFSPNSAMLATGGDGETAILWDVSNFSLKREFEGHDATVTSMTFSPDSKCLATGCTNGDMKVWDAAFGHAFPLITKVEAHDLGICSLHFNPSIGKRDASVSGSRYLLASGGQDTDLHIWTVSVGEVGNSFVRSRRVGRTEPASLKLHHTLCGHRAPIMMVKFDPSGVYLVSASGDKTVRLWDMTTLKAVAVLEGHSRYVTSCCFSEDGSLVASGGGDRFVRVWRMAEATMIDQSLAPCASNDRTTTEKQPSNKTFRKLSSKERTRDEYLGSWTVMDVCEWLSEEGLGEYCANFRVERINGRELMALNDSLLKSKLGVDALGHRNRILRFINSKKVGEQSTSSVSSSANPESKLPKEFFCPITQELMKDPVLCADGFSYEREAMELWLSRGNEKSPVTNLKLAHFLLTPNRTLKNLIQHFREQIS